ncbi:MAG: S41 family peptidase [Candidatus Levybacteria bacterium]|nr:S41 family peptidase [Candidatus Levybacteria bacterium]
MNRIKILQILLGLFIAFVFGYYFGVNKVTVDWKAYKPNINVISKEPPSGISNVNFTPFWTVWEKLLVQYYDKSKLDQQKMLNGAISGMVQALGDPFTIYLPPTQNNDFKEGLAGQFSGIGAELGTKDRNIIVIAPLDGSPAQKAGVKAGDTIVTVDGKLTVGWNISEAVEKIRGPKGTQVELGVVHKDTDKKVDIKITRDIINVKSVAMEIKSADCNSDSCKITPKTESCSKQTCINFLYIRLSQFGDNTNQEWLSMVGNISQKVKNDKNIKGIVFDLRNNPGGYLTDAAFIASEFLDKGKAVVSQDNGITDKSTMYVTRDGLFLKEKIIVLINKGSASAAEIVSGALRDNNRAKLVGETSFGKGTIQTAEDLGDGAGLHITIAKWLTPNGTWVNEKGLTPDVTVSLDANNPSRDTQLEKGVSELLK